MALTEDQVRREDERAREHWRRTEENASTPKLAARYRRLRRMADAGLEGQAQLLKAEAGLLPCPACGEWSDLTAGTCPVCCKPVDWQAVKWKTGTWQVDLTFLLLFGAVTEALCWFILSPDGWIVMKLAAALLLVPAGWLTYLNGLRTGRLLVWKLRQSGR